MWRIVSFRRRADLLLAVTDVVIGALACWLAYLLRFQGELPLPVRYAADYIGTSIGAAVAFVFAARGSGLYRRSALRLGEPNLTAAVESATLIGIALLVIDQFALNGRLSRAWIGLVVLFLAVAGVGSRGLLRRSRRLLVPLGVALERYAVLGTGLSSNRLVRDLTRAKGTPYEILGAIDAADAAAVVSYARSMRLDGVIMPVDLEHLAAKLAPTLAADGIDLLLAPRFGQLELRVASLAVFHGVPLLRVAGLTPRRRAVRRRSGSLRQGVAILGTRGIPANYGGFETFAERLSVQLVAQGIPVTVYCRRHYATAGSEWQGVQLITLPTIQNKYLDTVVHTLLSSIHLVLRTRIRKVILCNAANAPVLPLLRLAARDVVMNVDGLEWRRGKWGVAGRAWYRLGEWLSVRLASVLVTDADEVRTYYRVRHDADSVMIPYGADLLRRGGPPPAELPVATDDFALYVSRWEPENNPELVATAHASAGVAMGLVMLGQATYDDELERRVRASAAPDAVLPGAIYGDGYRALLCSARCYIHATEVGGTHPALVEAMGAGNLCLVLDTPENREVAGDVAWYFADEAELADLLRRVERLNHDELDKLRQMTRESAAERFSWEAVTDSYLQLLRS